MDVQLIGPVIFLLFTITCTVIKLKIDDIASNYELALLEAKASADVWEDSKRKQEGTSQVLSVPTWFNESHRKQVVFRYFRKYANLSSEATVYDMFNAGSISSEKLLVSAAALEAAGMPLMLQGKGLAYCYSQIRMKQHLKSDSNKSRPLWS